MHIKLRPNSKKPEGEAWTVSDNPEEVQQWISQGFNLGRIIQGIVVVDFDEKEAAREFYRAHRDILSVIVETRKGAHFYFSGETQTRKFSQGDIKGNGYVVCDPSVVQGWTYRVVQTGILKPFPELLFPRMVSESGESPVSHTIHGEIRDLRAYIGKITSISGQHGSDACFRVACVLRDAGLSEVDALAELCEWNMTNADPPWTVKDLAKKTKDAYRKGG